MSVYGVGPEAGTIEFLYNVTGTGTHALASLPVGGAMDIVGPLGNTFTLPPGDERIMVVARAASAWRRWRRCCGRRPGWASRSRR